ncbi:MAG: LysM peptidoglycan-binding domain-containing protein [Bacteroidia bacterium]
MNCPVCNTTELSDDTQKCPQCESDLEIFRLIVQASGQRQKNKKIISALGLFAAITAIGWASAGIFSGKKAETAIEPLELCPEVTVQNSFRPAPSDSERVSMLSKEIEALRSENASLSAKIHLTKEKPTSKTAITAAVPSTEDGAIIYTVKNGDTFWIISKKCFHDGRKYKQIAQDNGMSPKQKLSKGMKLKIQK